MGEGLSLIVIVSQVIVGEGVVRVSEGEGIIKCHQYFDATWGRDAIFVLGLVFASGQADVFGLLAGILILTSPPGDAVPPKRSKKRCVLCSEKGLFPVWCETKV